MEVRADCIHCGEPVDDSDVDHWKTCPAHPANEEIAKLKTILAALLDRVQILGVDMSGNHSYIFRRGRETAEAIQAARDILERG